jgi:hypothetical protein
MYQKYQQPHNSSVVTCLSLDAGAGMGSSGTTPEQRRARFDVDAKHEAKGVSVTIGITASDGSTVGTVTMAGLSEEGASTIETTLSHAASRGDPLEMVQGFEDAFLAALLEDASVSADFIRGGFEISAYVNDALTRSMQEEDFLKAMSVRTIAENIFHVNCPVKYVLTSTLLRFQEHYESSKFRNAIFSLEEFKSWFRGTREHGQFSYYDDVGGFNFPSSVLIPFVDRRFDPLSAREKALLSLLPNTPHDFYVVGTYGDQFDLTHLRHEIAHGLYYTNQDYRGCVDLVLEGLDVKPLEALLRQHGYHESVFRDEGHAYLGDDLENLQKMGITIEPYAKAHEQLLQLYNQFFSLP